jgi:hypothetical protein
MLSWIAIVLLYVLGMGMLRLLGGVGAAGEAFRRWGESASLREQGTSPSA